MIVKNSIKPALKILFDIKPIQMAIGFDEDFLTGIFGILSVAQHIHRHGYDFSPVFIHNFAELLLFSLKTASDKLFVIHQIVFPNYNMPYGGEVFTPRHKKIITQSDCYCLCKKSNCES